MKFSINQTELQNALGTVLKGTSSKSTLPILSGIFIEAKEDSLIFQATNLDLSIQYQAKALVEEPGKTVLPGKLFFDIVKSMNDAAVHITTNDEGAAIICDSSLTGDALSTTCMTLGYEKAAKLINSLSDTEAEFILTGCELKKTF